MQFTKKIISLLLCISTVAGAVFSASITVSAASGPVISVSKTSAVPGDTVAVSIELQENPGMMAATFTLSFNNSVLTLENNNDNIIKGTLSGCTVKAHEEKGYISIVYHNGKYRDTTDVGTFASFKFKIKEGADVGSYPLKIRNINPEDYGDDLKGCFASWDKGNLTPEITDGSITVNSPCMNDGHKYSEWSTTVKPTCTSTGINSRKCLVCGHTENETLKATGHDFENEWTIDRPATESVQGIMSRHCKNCSAVKDETFFSLPEAERKNIENSESAKITGNEQNQLVKTEGDENIKGEDNQTSNISNGTDAVKIIGNTKSLSGSIVARIHNYFFGGNGRKGILMLIAGAIPKSTRTFIKNEVLGISLAVIFLFMF